MSSWLEQRSELEQFAKENYDHSIKLYPRTHWISKTIFWIIWTLVLIFTLGFKRYSKEKYFEFTAAAIANLQFYPERWTVQQVKNALPHEGRHTEQLSFFGFGTHPLVGLPIAGLVYLFLPLPVFGAFGRVFMELDADVAKWKYQIKKYRYIATEAQIKEIVMERAESFAEFISGPTYFYPLPKKLTVWLFKRKARKVLDEEGLG